MRTKEEQLQTPNSCPKCESEDITADKREADSNYISQDVFCDFCGFNWNEVYTLTDIKWTPS